MKRNNPASWCVGLAITLLAAYACEEPAPTVPRVTDVQFGKPGDDPTVKSAVPDTATQGTTLDVEINGSGFDEGTAVQFAIAGVPSAKILVHSTEFVSSRKVRSNITVEPDADVTLYDIIVMTARGRPGIGTELFEVKPIRTPSAVYPLIWTVYAQTGAGTPVDVMHDQTPASSATYEHEVCNVRALLPPNGKPKLGVGDNKISPQERGCMERRVWVTLAVEHLSPDKYDHSLDVALSDPVVDRLMGIEIADEENPNWTPPAPPNRADLSLETFCNGSGEKGPQGSAPGLRFNPHEARVWPLSDLLDITVAATDPAGNPTAWQAESQPYPNNMAGCMQDGIVRYFHVSLHMDAVMRGDVAPPHK